MPDLPLVLHRLGRVTYFSANASELSWAQVQHEQVTAYMHTRPVIVTATVPIMVIVAAVLLTAASSARSDENSPGIKAGPRVTEMLQSRQESRLREQLVKEGRWDEVRKMDEEQARRQQERQQKIVAQINEKLSRSAKTDSSATALIGDACDRESLRMRQLISARAGKNKVDGSPPTDRQ